MSDFTLELKSWRRSDKRYVVAIKKTNFKRSKDGGRGGQWVSLGSFTLKLSLKIQVDEVIKRHKKGKFEMNKENDLTGH